MFQRGDAAFFSLPRLTETGHKKGKKMQKGQKRAKKGQKDMSLLWIELNQNYQQAF